MIYDLEFYLATLHSGQWFTFSNEENKTYSNLVVISDDVKPTEQECIDGVAALQAEYDANDYARQRKVKYDALNQFELIADDSINGTTTHKDAILAIKAEIPKQ
jgi:hypothetical protein